MEERMAKKVPAQKISQQMEQLQEDLLSITSQTQQRCPK
jgi:hypothetical protein